MEMVSKWVIAYFQMGYIDMYIVVKTLKPTYYNHLLTSWDIQALVMKSCVSSWIPIEIGDGKWHIFLQKRVENTFLHIN